MRLHIDACLRAITMATLFMLAGAVPVQSQSGPANAESPGQAEIAHAIERVKADPNLATERTIKTLRWKDSTKARRSGTHSWLGWIAGLFRWLEQSVRTLVWCAATVLAGLLVVFVVRMVRTSRVARREEPFVPPTHVRELDIRPESLPLDIGVAARLLWDRGEHRASLALLYRGLLSRLAHVHRIPIRGSSTEGDCLLLAASHLTHGTREYASHLIRVWQRFVYGREEVQAPTVYGLCDDFACELDRALPTGSAGSGDAA